MPTKGLFLLGITLWGFYPVKTDRNTTMHRIFYILIAVLALQACGPRDGDKPKTALDSLSLVIKEDSNNAGAYHERAKLFLNLKKYPEAFKDMTRALDIDTTKAAFFLTYADLCMLMKKSGNAESSLLKCIQLDPKNTEALLKLGELYLYVKDYQQALNYSNEALKVDEHLARGYFTKGMAYLDMGDTGRAVNNFLTTVEQDPDYLVAYENLGIIAAKKGDPLAEQYFKNALKINAQDVNVRYLLGEFYQTNGRFDEAMAQYATITQIMPNNRSAHYNIGYINFVYKEDYAEAIKHFNEAINADANYFEAYYMRGVCNEKLKNMDAAAADYKMALQKMPNYDKAVEGLKRIGR